MNAKDLRLHPGIAKELDDSHESTASPATWCGEASALEDKALLCIDIIQRIFPKYSDDEVEIMAIELMNIKTETLKGDSLWPENRLEGSCRKTQ